MLSIWLTPLAAGCCMDPPVAGRKALHARTPPGFPVEAVNSTRQKGVKVGKLTIQPSKLHELQ